MATTVPASVSPPGQWKLLPGLTAAGTAPGKPSCLRCRQPLRPETGPRCRRLSAEASPLLADGLGEQIAVQLHQAQ